MGYNIAMPDFDIGHKEVSEQQIILKLRKGPNQTLENTLVLSDQSADTVDNIFEFSLKAFISHDQAEPDDRAIRRGKENKQLIGGDLDDESSYDVSSKTPLKRPTSSNTYNPLH